jgi:hypothetical protein
VSAEGKAVVAKREPGILRRTMDRLLGGDR